MVSIPNIKGWAALINRLTIQVTRVTVLKDVNVKLLVYTIGDTQGDGGSGQPSQYTISHRHENADEIASPPDANRLS